MKILISGATGFIGKHLIKRFKTKHNIYAVVRPSTNLDYLKKEKIKYFIYQRDVLKLSSFINKNNFDGVIHLASLFLSSHKITDIDNLINSNLLFPTELLEASTHNNVKWFINTGTFWQHYQNKRYSPVNLYAATKQAFEDIAKYYIESSDINFTTIKLSDTFGPNDTRKKILNLWMDIANSNNKIDMSPGNQIIDINYIENIIDGYEKMVHLLAKDKNRNMNGKTFAIKAKKRLKLKELAQIFEKTTKTKLNINWGNKKYRFREVMKPWDKGEEIPGWKQNISIEKGIIKTFNKK